MCFRKIVSVTSYANIVPNFKKEYKNSIKKIKQQCFVANA